MSGGRRLAWAVAAVGTAAVAVGVAWAPGSAREAATQDWPPFVLVAGLLLVGLVAAEDGVFEAAGARLAAMSGSGAGLFVAAMILVAVVTAVLNLDTAVAFLTPVLVATSRAHGRATAIPASADSPDGPPLQAPMLYGCLLMSNAASLLLPGSNLTNLIVVGHLHLSGGRFALRMAAPWVASVALTTAAVGLLLRRHLRRVPVSRGDLVSVRPRGPIGLVAVVVATAVVVTDASPALPVLVVGVVAAAVRLGRSGTPRHAAERMVEAVGAPVLVGLLGVAIGAGTLGRQWSGPTALLGHLGAWATAAFAAVLSIVVNNLPAASLLAARHPAHPFAILVGLDLGPNLLVTGSLSSILWWQSARAAGARPRAATVSRLGLVAAPLAGVACLALLAVSGTR